jgi:hypothetical protein
VTLSAELRLYQERVLREYQHARIIDRLDRQHLLRVLQHEQAMDQTGILGIVSGNVRVIHDNVARLAAVSERALPAIVEHLALTADRLGSIAEILANPTETAAAEFYRRGSFALASGWFEEAVSDLRLAVDTYPYHPKSWFNLGIAMERQNLGDESAEAFLRCARYSATSAQNLAATAVLLAAAVHRRMGRPEEAAAALHKFLPDLDRCAEIHLALAIHHDQTDHLSRALELAPALAADAAANARPAQAPSVESAATMACSHEEGPVARLRRLELAAQRLAEAVSEAGLDGVGELSAPVLLPEAGVSCLLLAETALPLSAERAERMVSEVQASIQPLEREAAHAKSQAAQARQNIENIAVQLTRAKQDLAQRMMERVKEEERIRSVIWGFQRGVPDYCAKIWEAERSARKHSFWADTWREVLAREDHRTLRLESGGSPHVDFRASSLLSGLGVVVPAQTDIEYHEKRAQEYRHMADLPREALRKTEVENQNLADKTLSRLDLPKPLLQAIIDAAIAAQRASDYQREVKEILHELADARREATKFRDPSWVADNRRIYLGGETFKETLLALPERWRELVLIYEDRLTQRADSVSELAQSIQQEVLVAKREVAEAENRIAEMNEMARREAERALEERSREEENAARHAYQESLARADRLSTLLQRAVDATRTCTEEVSCAIAAAVIPRDRIIPFALTNQFMGL